VCLEVRIFQVSFIAKEFQYWHLNRAVNGKEKWECHFLFGRTASVVVISDILLSQDGKWYQFNFPFVVTKALVETRIERKLKQGDSNQTWKSFLICAKTDTLMYIPGFNWIFRFRSPNKCMCHSDPNKPLCSVTCYIIFNFGQFNFSIFLKSVLYQNDIFHNEY